MIGTQMNADFQDSFGPNHALRRLSADYFGMLENAEGTFDLKFS